MLDGAVFNWRLCQSRERIQAAHQFIKELACFFMKSFKFSATIALSQTQSHITARLYVQLNLTYECLMEK